MSIRATADNSLEQGEEREDLSEVGDKHLESDTSHLERTDANDPIDFNRSMGRGHEEYSVDKDGNIKSDNNSIITDRRTIMAAIAGATGLAGCSSEDDDSSDPTSTVSRTETDTATVSPTDTPVDFDWEESVKIDPARPGEEYKIEVTDENADNVRYRLPGMTKAVEGRRFTHEYGTVGEKQVQVEVDKAGETFTKTLNIDIPEWSFEEIYREELELEKFSNLKLPEEARNAETPSRQLEEAHTWLTKEYEGQTITKQIYPTAMRAAAQQLGIKPKEHPVLNRRNNAGTYHIAVPHKGENKMDLGHAFPEERNYIRADEPITQDEKSSSTASALAGYREDSSANVLNVVANRENIRFDRIDDKEAYFSRMDVANDYMFADVDRSGDPKVGFEWEVGQYMDDLKVDNEFIINGSLFLNNNVGSEEFMHVDIADSEDELEQKYSNVEVLTERDGKVFAATIVGEEEHEEAMMNLYLPEKKT